ncbi:TRAP transporter large permease [Candidatus Nitrotoga sp. M5]|uniref:TRAP transporter large permease n=1 Tax=Candidatus Nitrotoga sp. M5 TaxID=2890409 RepID=UPI001EF61FAD|nr:TRAP transporter large permease subunit [Candidatus Nitrotoga sp. M5]CAH1387505.1 TRAP transporter large permease [Candidatus Nitrotoga sp. M5]
MLGAGLLLLLVLIALSIPVAAVLGILGILFSHFFSPMPLDLAMGEMFWQSNTDSLLVAIPMFILLGEIMLRAGIAAKLYGALAQWLAWLPGGLMHANIGACMMFAATSGSSVATAATVGTVALPEIEKHRYNETLYLGTLAAGGTLGILIPPSINIIIYGMLTETSVPSLYLAGFIPGFLLAVIFSVMVIISCFIRRAWGGVPVQTSWELRMRTLPNLLPPLFIFILVIGSIYGGVATPTEASSLGVVGAIILAAFNRSLSWEMLRLATEGTMRMTAILLLIIAAATFLNFVISAIGLTHQLTVVVQDIGFGKVGTMIAIIIFYIVLGCFMETFSMMITTIPLIFPIVITLGYDPIWYGIVLVILMEMSLITPPFGLNLFVIQSLRKTGNFSQVVIGASVFVVTMLFFIAALMIFPQIALWLPGVH